MNPTRLIVVGMAAAAAAVMADIAYCGGRMEGKRYCEASGSVEADPSPEDTDTVESDDEPNPTESDAA